MNQYTLSLHDINTIDNKSYYRLRIATNQSTCSRIVRVRYADLLALHKQLASDNYNHIFPPFPEKSLFSSMFQNSETQTELLQNRSDIQTYLNGISKNPPIRSDAITTFILNAVDPLRVLELHFEQVPKEQLQKKYSKTTLLKRSRFNKVFRVSYDKQVTLAMHQFLLPQSDLAKIDYDNYKRAQSQIIDYTHILMTLEIGQIIKSKPMMSRLFNKKVKKTVYNDMGLSSDASYDVFYAIEEFATQPMNELIGIRQQTQEHFEIDVIADAIFTLASAAQYLQFLQINQRQFQLSTLFWNEQKGFRIGGINPVFNFKRKYKLKYQFDVEATVMVPPEQSGALGYKIQFPSNKGDVWQIGILVLCISALCHPCDLPDPEQINNKLKLVGLQYGYNQKLSRDTLMNLLKGMLERNPYDRLQLSDIINTNQLILPIKLTYLNLKSIPSRQRVNVNDMSIVDLEVLDKYFKGRVNNVCRYHVHIVLEYQQTDSAISVLVILGENKEGIYSEYRFDIVEEIDAELIDKTMRILVESQHIQQLRLDMKHSTLCEAGLISIIKSVSKMSTLTTFCLDITKCASILQMCDMSDIKCKYTIYMDSSEFVGFKQTYIQQ